MLNDYDELFAALVYSEEEWRELSRFPLGWNIHSARRRTGMSAFEPTGYVLDAIDYRRLQSGVRENRRVSP